MIFGTRKYIIVEVKLEKTEQAVNVRRRGGSLIVRIPPSIVKLLKVEEGQLCLVFINRDEKILGYRFLSKKS